MTGTNVTKCFSDRLQDLISDSGKDVKTLASEIGVSSGALSKYQNDKGEPGITALCKIADYFGVTADYLIGISDNKTPENVSIGQATGLSDDAIKQLALTRNNKLYNAAFNYLIIQHNCLLHVINYLLSSIASEVDGSEYWFIPMSYNDPDVLSDVKFSAIIRNLPMLEKEFKDYVTKNMRDEIILEFIRINYDRECFDSLFLNGDKKSAAQIRLFEEIIGKENKVPVKEALENFIAYCKSKKEGAINADNPEAR